MTETSEVKYEVEQDVNARLLFSKKLREIRNGMLKIEHIV